MDIEQEPRIKALPDRPVKEVEIVPKSADVPSKKKGRKRTKPEKELTGEKHVMTPARQKHMEKLHKASAAARQLKKMALEKMVKEDEKNRIRGEAFQDALNRLIAVSENPPVDEVIDREIAVEHATDMALNTINPNEVANGYSVATLKDEPTPPYVEKLLQMEQSVARMNDALNRLSLFMESADVKLANKQEAPITFNPNNPSKDYSGYAFGTETDEHYTGDGKKGFIF